jgi:hypothetical protein
MHVFDDIALADLGLDTFDFVDAVSAALMAHHHHDLTVLPKRMQSTASGAYAMDTQGMWLSRDMAVFHNLVGLDKPAIVRRRSSSDRVTPRPCALSMETQSAASCQWQSEF